MLTGKQRAQLRAQSNSLDTTLMVGKEGVTEQVVSQADSQLLARELIKGRVLESALMTAREASDAICAATGADGVQTVGSKFVIYRVSEKKRQQEAAKKRMAKKLAANPVRKGAQARRKQAKQAKAQREEFFHQAAVQAAIDRRRAAREEQED